ncbi:sigma-E factor negative regulatory protein [Aromatoleum petrolei]|uniref:Anti-sigma 24 factor n=1 Tax=Aromatoleum petrolei TaxID=76116 RepID=A0ABX1MRV5_9RHOO|nr:RseA family anti-sigma factor [Aromatoleum petrolei]NMF89338.1 anti-sigma 24 factor [Aromatoleum petrolei]QTQ35168.1 Anti sigma-E protein [Aromatoleum petrolei]
MKDRLSALLDGDLDEQSAHPVFESMRRDRALRTDWEAYCLIGDVLRGDRDGNAGFVGRVMANIDEEPTLLAPSRHAAAEGGRLWRSLMPLAASVMGVAAVGWVAHTLYSDQAQPSVGQIAVAQSSTAVAAHAAVRPVAVSPSPVAVDPTREYVFVHQAMSGGGPISGVIQHVRTVSDVGQGSGR